MRPKLSVVRVFLVDEHEVVRRGVATVLEADPEITVVGEAGSVRQALRRATAVRPDVAVVAPSLSDGSGAYVCQRLQALVPGVRCLVLGESVADETVHAIRAGAWGYLGKHVPGPVLLAAVRKAASSRAALDPGVAARPENRVDETGDPLAPLTPQERAVFRLIGEGLTNRQIAERMRLAPKTVKNKVSIVLAKLGLDNRTQAAILATQLRRGPRDGEPVAIFEVARFVIRLPRSGRANGTSPPEVRDS